MIRILLALLLSINICFAGTTRVVEYYTSECPVCRELAPNFAAVSQEYRGRAVFSRVNCDNSSQCEAYDIVGVPTIIIFKNGQEVAEHVGYMSESELSNFVGNNI